MLGFFGGFWDDWNLLHKVTFDGVERLIIIAPEVTDIDVRVDLYSDWKEWMTIRDYAKFPRAFRTIGGDATVPGERAGDSYFLMNGWRIVSWQGNHKLDVDGSLFVDGTTDSLAGGPFNQGGRSTGSLDVNINPSGSYAISIRTRVASLVNTIETGGGSGTGLTDADRATLENTEAVVTAIQTIVDNLPDSGTLSTLQSTVTDILSVSRLSITNIVSGSFYEVRTTLTEPDEFYNGIGCIITSGSVGVTRKVNSYSHYSGTIYFDDPLSFVPISGSQLVLITQHDTDSGGRR